MRSLAFAVDEQLVRQGVIVGEIQASTLCPANACREEAQDDREVAAAVDALIVEAGIHEGVDLTWLQDAAQGPQSGREYFSPAWPACHHRCWSMGAILTKKTEQHLFLVRETPHSIRERDRPLAFWQDTRDTTACAVHRRERAHQREAVLCLVPVFRSSPLAFA
jgi:hypothetical protein